MSAHSFVSTRDNRSRIPWWIYLFLVCIFFVGGLARVFLLRDTPGWYADEGSDIEIATHLMNGEQRYFAIGQSTLVAGRLPLFHLILAGLFSIFGRDILVLRMLTTIYGILIVLLLFVLGRRIWGPNLALLATLMYAIYPNAILYSRFGFLYNQIALLNFVLFYALWRGITNGSRWWLVVACLSIGLSLITNVSTLPLIGFLVLVLFFTRRFVLWWAVPLALCLPVLYGLWMMAYVPQAFFNDLGFMFNRVGGHQLFRIFFIVWNYKELLLWDAWFPIAAFGLTRLRSNQGRLYTQAFFWYYLLATVGGVSMVTHLGYHYMIPLLPWTAVGMAAFVMWAFPRLIAELENIYNSLYNHLPQTKILEKWYKKLQRPGQVLVVGLILFWVLLSPFVAMAIQARLAPGRTFPEMEQVTVRSILDAEAVVTYVNRHVTPNDLVLAPPHIAWMIEARITDFQQAAVCAGGGAINYPKNMDLKRFLFDCSVENARYVLLWAGWRDWTAKRMPDVEEIFQTVEKWPIAYESGEWQVFANPKHQENLP